MSSSAAPTGVVVPTKGGEPLPTQAGAAKPMAGGGLVLSPLPLGGGKRRGTRRLSKKVLKTLKKMTPKQLKKLMKGGEGETAMEETAPATGARRRRGSRKTRRSGLLY